MKNKLKMFGIIAIVAVIGFWAVSCGDDDDGGSGDAIVGNTITSGAEVVYGSSIINLTEAKNATDFSFMYLEPRYGGKKNYPLSDLLDGSPSVKINDNKVTIILCTPKSAYLENFNDMPEGITVNPSDAKRFFLEINTSDNKYSLICMKDDDNSTILVYVDRDVTIKGTEIVEEHGEKWTYNASLKKGWNYIFTLYNKTTDIGTITSSTTQTNSYKWTVLDWGYGW